MAGNGRVVEDEESVYDRSRVQPFGFTPMQEERKMEESNKRTVTLWSEVLGLQDLISLQVWRASIAELLGTAVLVFAIDTIVISSYETETKATHLIMSTLVAITIAILLLATIPVSGGHINPVVTLAAMLTGLVSISRALVYILAQCLGGIVGALALKAVVDSTIEQTFSLGGCTLTVVTPSSHGPLVVGIETSQALSLEIMCTFVFLFAAIWLAFDHHQAEALGRVIICSIIGTVVGLLVFVSTTVTETKGYAGAGMNPARCLGPAVIRGGYLWDGHWVFWVGPAVACVAFALYVKIIPREREG